MLSETRKDATKIDDSHFVGLVNTVKALLVRRSWTSELAKYLGNQLGDKKSQDFYRDLLTHKDNLDEALSNYKPAQSLTEGLIETLFKNNVLMVQGYVDSSFSEPAYGIINFLGSYNHHELIIGILEGLKNCQLKDNPKIIPELSKLLPQNSIPIACDLETYYRTCGSIECFFNMYSFFLEKYAIQSLYACKQRNSKITNDYLEAASQVLTTLPESLRGRVVKEALEIHSKNKLASGFIMSLESIDLTHTYPFSHDHDFHPAECVSSFWSSIEQTPDFHERKYLARYLTHSLILIESKRIHALPMVGIDFITENEWSLVSQLFARVSFSLQQFSTNIDDVKNCLALMRSLDYPFDSEWAAEGVLTAFDRIHSKLNERVWPYRPNNANQQIFPLETQIVARCRQYPVRIKASSRIEAGSTNDLTKSRALLLLAEYGLIINQRTLNWFLTFDKKGGLIKMPYQEIVNFVNWAHGKFLCLSFKSELGQYSFEEGITQYRSKTDSVAAFVNTLLLCLHGIPSSYTRWIVGKSKNNMPIRAREIPEIFPGDIEFFIGYLELFFTQTIPNYDCIEDQFKKTLKSTAKEFIFQNFDHDPIVISDVLTICKHYTPMNNMAFKRRGKDSFSPKNSEFSEEGEPRSDEKVESIVSDFKKCQI